MLEGQIPNIRFWEEISKRGKSAQSYPEPPPYKLDKKTQGTECLCPRTKTSLMPENSQFIITLNIFQQEEWTELHNFVLSDYIFYCFYY